MERCRSGRTGRFAKPLSVYLGGPRVQIPPSPDEYFGAARKLEHLIPLKIKKQPGGVAEWSNALVLKTSRPSRVSEVRILSPPPDIERLFKILIIEYANLNKIK